MSPSTSNHYLTALKTFGNWLLKDRRCAENPFVQLTRVNAKVDIRCVRRSSSQEELSWLVATAASCEPFRELTGPDRAVLYLLAAFTGLRVSELASLTDRSFDLQSEPPTLTVIAACSKRRREDVLPLHPQLAAKLRVWLDARLNVACSGDVISITGKGEPLMLFPGTWIERAAPMIRRDMAAARHQWIEDAKTKTEKAEREQSNFLIPETDDGRADFHALRHTFVSNLATSGVHPKLAKELARHSTITLTMDRYAHVGLLDMNAALESLPAVRDDPQETQKAAATGTASDLVAPMVAPLTGDIRTMQELSRETAATGEGSSDGRNVNTHEELSEELITPEEWWGGDLNPRPAGYESVGPMPQLAVGATGYGQAGKSVAPEVAHESPDSACELVSISDDLRNLIDLWPRLTAASRSSLTSLAVQLADVDQ